jgi:AcrR family transcriptional regulator
MSLLCYRVVTKEAQLARNREKTREKILAAARNILARDGFAALKVNRLAIEAGVGKPLIYRYFGSMDRLGQALIEESNAEVFDRSGYEPGAMADSQTVLKVLVAHGRALSEDRLARDLLAWSLGSSESPDQPAGHTAASDQHPAPGTLGGDDPAAVFTLLKAAIAFIMLARDRHGAFAGMALEKAGDMARLEYAMAAIVKQMWRGPDLD